MWVYELDQQAYSLLCVCHPEMRWVAAFLPSVWYLNQSGPGILYAVWQNKRKGGIPAAALLCPDFMISECLQGRAVIHNNRRGCRHLATSIIGVNVPDIDGGVLRAVY